jgi:lipopolysaccharide transport system ATP-binding protein
VLDTAVRATGLGKVYRIGERQGYRTLREVIATRTQGSLRRKRERLAPGPQFFRALSDVSFELAQGEVFGVIGRNGAGKSTLLKILSRITPPTEGNAAIAGKVGALLEIGTGFHPELTGRENVLLNGAVLGLRRAETVRLFDDIVAFANVEPFIDTPVKRYSTGMRARLAFSVAAHLEPDVLIVDEVLAVGDAEFQKRCMGRMGESARSGRTVIFVSHNMTAVESLCSRVLWLDGGRCIADGSPGEIISRYLSASFSTLTEQSWPDRSLAPGDDSFRMRSASARPSAGRVDDAIHVDTAFLLEFEYWNLRAGARLNLSLHLFNEQGVMVFNALPMTEEHWQGRPMPTGLFRDTCHIPSNLLNNGVHRVKLLAVSEGTEIILELDDVLIFDVRDVAQGREGWHGEWEGAVRPRLHWETTLISPGAGSDG